MARWQIVVKKSEAKKQSKDRNFNNKNKHWTDKQKSAHTKQQNGRRGAGGKKANN